MNKLTPEQNRQAVTAIVNAVANAVKTNDQTLQNWAARMADESIKELFPDALTETVEETKPE